MLLVLQMAFLGRLQCPAPALVPAVYRGTATASMAAPSEGVEVAVATASHLLELAEGLVVRCCALPRGMEVDEVGRVEGLVGGQSAHQGQLEGQVRNYNFSRAKKKIGKKPNIFPICFFLSACASLGSLERRKKKQKEQKKN